MRAKTVLRKAYIFDFDDTLVKTEAKVYVYKNGKFIKSLTPEQFNTYIKSPDEEIDISEFKDPRLIMSARKYKMWPALQNINNAILQGRSSSQIFILTARSPIARNPIHKFLKSNNIFIPEENIITIGDDAGEINIAEEKKRILIDLKSQFDNIIFFDDNPENIRLAQEISGISTRLIEFREYIK